MSVRFYNGFILDQDINPMEWSNTARNVFMDTWNTRAQEAILTFLELLQGVEPRSWEGAIEVLFPSNRSYLLKKRPHLRVTKNIGQQAIEILRLMNEMPGDAEIWMNKLDLRDAFMLFYNEQSNTTFGKVFSPEPEVYLDALVTLTGVSKFEYWDNADEPEDVDEEMWKLYGTLYKETLNDGPLSLQGLCFDTDALIHLLSANYIIGDGPFENADVKAAMKTETAQKPPIVFSKKK